MTDPALVSDMSGNSDTFEAPEPSESNGSKESQLDLQTVIFGTDEVGGERLYVCSFCPKSFKTVGGNERHMKAKHNVNFLHCPGCLERFMEKDLLPHLMICTAGTEKAQVVLDDIDQTRVELLAVVENPDDDKMFEMGAGELWEELSGDNKDAVLVNFETMDTKPQFLTPSEPIGTFVDCDLEDIPIELLRAFYRCPDCKMGFETNAAFTEHVNFEHGYSFAGAPNANDVGKHRCRVCHKLFPNPERLFRHGQRSHKMEKCSLSGEPIYRCACCGKICKTYNQLRRHRNMNHRVKPFTCRDCNLFFNSQGDQIYHRMRYHRKQTCNQCQIVFQGLVSFKEHVRTCHPGVPVYKVNKQLVCEFCSGTFADEKHLDDHIQSKHLGRIHSCDVCGKVLGTAETLKIHLRLHKAETYRTCDVCGKQFGRLAGLMEHMRSRHPENVPEKYRFSISCPHCGLAFSRSQTLRRHIENKHEGKTFTCEICGKVFRCKRYIIRHKKAHHPGSMVSKDNNRLKNLVVDDEAGVQNELKTSLRFLTECSDESL